MRPFTYYHIILYFGNQNGEKEEGKMFYGYRVFEAITTILYRAFSKQYFLLLKYCIICLFYILDVWPNQHSTRKAFPQGKWHQSYFRARAVLR